MMYITMSARFRVGIACAVATLFFLSFEAAVAATLVGPVDTTVDKTAEYTKTVDVSGHTNLKLDFKYDAESLDNGDSFSYGWRAGTHHHFLGIVYGADEGISGDERGFVSTPLYVSSGIDEIEFYIRVDANTTSPADEVVITDLTITGDSTVPDAEDTDSDGVNDDADNCPATPNPDQEDLDGDGIGDACDVDDDGDGIADHSDNCPITPNPVQKDFDGDGIGDACDVDDDGDGVDDADDLCPDTIADEFAGFEKKQAKNRWAWDGEAWVQSTSSKSNQGGFSPTIEETKGCSGEQILDIMSDLVPDEDFGGHYKYGLSKGLLEDWIAGEYHVGPTFVETVAVPVDGTSASSDTSLSDGTDYWLEASGKYRFANWGEYGIADAEWAYRDGAHTSSGNPGWVKGEGYYSSACGLDIQVDGSCVDWGAYSAAHEYSLDYVGTGSPVSFSIHDSSYGDNDDSTLSVDIIEDKWVDLW